MLDYGGTLKVGNLLEFLKEGGNVLLATNSQVSEAARDFAIGIPKIIIITIRLLSDPLVNLLYWIEFSADWDEKDSRVVDAFNSVGNLIRARIVVLSNSFYNIST